MTIKKEPVLKGIRVNLTKFGIVYYFENEEDRSEFLKSTSFESLLEFRLKLTNEKEYALKYHTDHQINDFEDLPQKLKKELKKRKKKEKETIWSFLYDYDDSLIKLLVEVFINTFKMIDDMVEKSKNVKIGEYFTISNYGKCINPIDLYFGINKITGHRPLIIPNLGYLSLRKLLIFTIFFCNPKKL